MVEVKMSIVELALISNPTVVVGVMAVSDIILYQSGIPDPAATVVQDKVPNPSVVRIWPLDPSAPGQV
jgi:hypothetical protein